jgi:hypothetical protein
MVVAALNDPPLVHHADLVRHIGRHLEIVRNEQAGDPGSELHIPEEVEDLCLDRRVKGRGHLVGDEKSGADRERAGNRNPLTLPTGELMGIPLGCVRLERDGLQQLRDLFGVRSAESA